MLKRTIVGLILAPLLVAVLLFAPKIVAVILAAACCAIAAYELLHGTKLVCEIRPLIYTMAMASLVPFWSYFDGGPALMVGAILAFYILLFLEAMITDLAVAFSKLAVCVVAGLVVPYMFSALVRILAMEQGRFYVLMPFVAAFLSDIGAYFVGVTIGKHKLCPKISPKKTIEGLIGGLTVAVLGMLLYAVILHHGFGQSVSYLRMAVYGLAGALCGVFGDLSFSVVKRQTGIKDYGNLFPGHGGVLDRCDSVIMAAPLIELLLLVLPVA